MAAPTVYHKYLEAFASAHVSDGFMEDDGDRMLGLFLKMQGSFSSALSEVRALKNQGNSLFRQNLFDKAASCYDEACKLLGLSLGNIGGEDIQSLSELAISLNSNLAACALKLEEFRATLDLCSMILETFPRNVKALFRRAVAYMKLGRFSEAKTDLVEALVVEPRNKDVKRELDVVKCHLLLKKNGKRVLEVDSDDGMKGSNKKHVQISDTMHVSEMNTKEWESGIMEETKDYNDVSIKENVSENLEMDDAESSCRTDQKTYLEKNGNVSNKSFLEFSKKGRESSRLRISGQDYQKLLQGNEMMYCYKKDLSTLTVRIRNIETIKEGGITREQCKEKKEKKKKKKKRRRLSRPRKLMMGVENVDRSSPSNINNTVDGCGSKTPSSCDISSGSSSTCDNFSPLCTQTPYENPMVVEPFLLRKNDPTTISSCSQTPPVIYDNQLFRFSASTKKSKTKMSRVPTTRIPCRYPPFCHVKGMKKITSYKKNHSQKDESLRHNISIFSRSRYSSHKFLRPRGVSVSYCRYSWEAQLIKKRKEVFAHLESSDRPLKKPFICFSPTLSCLSFSTDVINKSDSGSRVDIM